MTNYNLFIQSKLPNILNLEELLNYFEKYHKGDQEAREIIINHNLKLVINRVLTKFLNTPYDTNELVSVGIIGLIKGVDTFDINKKINFSTYAIRCIDNEILMFLRKNKKRKGEVSFEDALNYDAEGNELHLEDILGTDEDLVSKEFESNQEKRILSSEINKLNPRDKQIMVLRYGLNNTEEYTQKEVAEMLGISQSYISRIEKKVIKNLKNLLKI